MSAIAFDTHAFVKRLTGAGMPEAQAEAIIAGIGEAREMDISSLATKADVRESELRIDAKLEKITGEMILLKWMLGLVVAGILALLLKAYFPH